MEQEKIKAIIKEQVDRLDDLSKEVGKEFDKDAIHDFRVAAKMLRSFIRLLRMQTNDKELKLTKSFKRLYQIAGAIRDAQLELERMIDKQTLLPTYMNQLEQKTAIQKQEWLKHYSKKVIKKMEHRLVDRKYGKINPEALPSFCMMQMTAIDTADKQQTILTDNELHTIRKHVKDIVYTTKLAKQKWKAGYKKAKDLSTDQLDILASEIGDYNDKRILLEHLSGFSGAQMAESEQAAIKALCMESADKLTQDKSKIVKIIKDIQTA